MPSPKLLAEHRFRIPRLDDMLDMMAELRSLRKPIEADTIITEKKMSEKLTLRRRWTL